MTFGEKFKKLRTDKSLTQDELAEKLYVTRTAISKWESDRGYPNIDSLKQIAKFFSVTVDELLSSGELLNIAEEENRQKEKYFLDSTLSSNYGKCLSLFIHNRFVYESDWTSHGNARAHALCASLKEFLFNAPAEIVEELIKVKETYHYDLPF